MTTIAGNLLNNGARYFLKDLISSPKRTYIIWREILYDFKSVILLILIIWTVFTSQALEMFFCCWSHPCTPASVLSTDATTSGASEEEKQDKGEEKLGKCQTKKRIIFLFPLVSWSMGLMQYKQGTTKQVFNLPSTSLEKALRWVPEDTLQAEFSVSWNAAICHINLSQGLPSFLVEQVLLVTGLFGCQITVVLQPWDGWELSITEQPEIHYSFRLKFSQSAIN